MQKIVKKLEELVGICEARVSKTNSEREELAALRIELNKQKEVADERDKNLDVREEQLRSLEVIGMSLHEAKQLVAEASDLKKQHKAKLDDLEVQKSNHDKKMVDEKAEIERQKEKIAKQNKETEENARIYKQQVMDEIIKNSVAGRPNDIGNPSKNHSK